MKTTRKTTAFRCTSNTREGKIFEGGNYASRRRMARVLKAAGFVSEYYDGGDNCVFVATRLQTQAMTADMEWQDGGSAVMYRSAR